MRDEVQAHDACGSEQRCTSGARNRYYIGKRLTQHAFELEQAYFLERRRLLNRAVHGWGVVYGYAVTLAGGGALEVGEGLAFDKPGREVLQTQSRRLKFAEVERLSTVASSAAGQATGTRRDGGGAAYGSAPDAPAYDARAPERSAPYPQAEPPRRDPECWLLSVHYAERLLGNVTLRDPCDCERHEWDRVCEDVWYSLQPIECDACCRGEPCTLCCECDPDCDDPPSRDNRGPHRCLCDHLTALPVGAEIDELCKVAEGIRSDLSNGVPLACVGVRRDECNELQFDRVVDACGPRPLVKRNDLLFDLIRGCDLAFVTEVSWAELHRPRDPVPWEQFASYFARRGDPDLSLTRLRIAFSKPMRADTVRADCFAIRVIVPEESSGWGDVLRVPIVGVRPEPWSSDPQYVRAATILVDAEWWEDEMENRRSCFRDEVTTVEIEVRGDFLLDCNGQRPDLNVAGLRVERAGNGTPGGTLLSAFQVQPRPNDSYRTATPTQASRRT